MGMRGLRSFDTTLAKTITSADGTSQPYLPPLTQEHASAGATAMTEAVKAVLILPHIHAHGITYRVVHKRLPFAFRHR